MPRTLTIDEAADLMKTSAETVSDCIHNRGLPAARPGRSFVLVDEDVIAWLRTQYGEWRQKDGADRGETACGSISGRRAASGGSTSARSAASALDRALAPATGKRRQSTPPPLRAIAGGSTASAKLPE